MRIPLWQIVIVVPLVALLYRLPASAQVDGQNNAARYPVRPVSVITPSPGGATDAIARIIGSAMAQSLNGTFVVDARSGAGGNIASEFVSRAPADGYTLLLALSSMLTINPVIYRNIHFDPVAGLQPIAMLGTTPYLLAVNPSVTANNVSELVAEAKATPQGLTYGSSGYGTPSHVGGVLFALSAGLDLRHVPYRTTSGATADVLAGQVNIFFGSLYSLLPFVHAGKLKGLGVTGATRSAFAPSIPTIAESIPGYDFLPWYGLLAPAKAPRDVTDKLSAATGKALQDREIRDRLAAQGVDVQFGDADQLRTRIRADLEKWSKILTAAGIRVE